LILCGGGKSLALLQVMEPHPPIPGPSICSKYMQPEGKRSLGIPRRRCKGNIKIDIKEIGYGAVAGYCEHGNEPSGCLK
jgi:hypothetical protein